MATTTNWLPCGERPVARDQCLGTVAFAEAPLYTRCMAGGGGFRVTSGSCRVSCVGDGTQERAGGLVLPDFSSLSGSFFWSGPGRTGAVVSFVVPLCGCSNTLCMRSIEQDRNLFAASGDNLGVVVEAWAGDLERGSLFSAIYLIGFGFRAIDGVGGASPRGCDRFIVGALFFGALSDCRSSLMVLCGKAGLARRVDLQLSALANRFKRMVAVRISSGSHHDDIGPVDVSPDHRARSSSRRTIFLRYAISRTGFF